jgi:signal transduction histidine kinase
MDARMAIDRTRDLLPTLPRRRAMGARGGHWLFVLFFSLYTAAVVLWLALGLVPWFLARGLAWQDAYLAWYRTLDTPWLQQLAFDLYAARYNTGTFGFIFFQYLFSVLNLVLGIALVRRRPDDWVPRLLALGMVGTAAVFNYQAHTALEYSSPVLNDFHEILHIFAGSTYLLALLLFPDGRLPPIPGLYFHAPRWISWPVRLLTLLIFAFFGYLFSWTTHGEPAGFVAFFGVLVPLTGITAQALRHRRARGDPARQLSRTMMLALGLALALALVIGLVALLLSLPALAPGARGQQVLEQIAFLIFPPLFALLPVALTFIVLRYRLWEINVLINRSLVYGTLTVLIAGLYALVVGSFSLVLQVPGNLVITILATGLMAVLFQPLRQRLQQAVNRLMYGERDDPATVLSRLGQRLEGTLTPEAVLPTIAETLAHTLRLPYVAVTVAEGSETGAGAVYQVPGSQVPASDWLRLPLIYQGEISGELVVAPRAPGENFTPAEAQLLADVARQAGVAVHAVHLAADLQRSRERLVIAREEERRRLRRDLHDGLGPQLASLALQIEAARNLVTQDPAAATPALSDLQSQVQTAIRDVRRLVHDLRPPALDQFGLVGALHEFIATRGTASGGLQVAVRAPESLPVLPAAVEVAAYHITLEALANVMRHSGASHCTVWLCLDDTLYLAVDDDGRGLPDTLRPGVGLASMRERAAELGGTCRVVRRPEGGTRVMVTLPLDLPAG